MTSFISTFPINPVIPSVAADHQVIPLQAHIGIKSGHKKDIDEKAGGYYPERPEPDLLPH